MSEKHWLLVEGTSFEATVFDTDDLATIRGASWALLDLPDFLGSALRRFSDGALAVQKVYAGASQGLYEVTVERSLPPNQTFASLVARLLSSGSSLTEAIVGSGGDADLAAVLAHMRFSFGVTPAGGLAELNAEILERLRRSMALRQYRSLDVDLPRPMSFRDRGEALFDAAITDPSYKQGAVLAQRVADGDLQSDLPCVLDRVRPREDFAWRSSGEGPQRTVPVSASSEVRKRFGRHGRRRDFYSKHARFDVDECYSFADSFEEIAADRDKPQGVPDSTFRKMAVLAMDGNAFTKISEAYVGADSNRAHREALASFSTAVLEKRSMLLAGLLDLFATNKRLQLNGPSKPRTDHEPKRETVLRLETLLWGADESILVFPAWAIEDVLKCLESLLGGAAGRLKLPDGTPANLSYAIGVVLCNYKTPIRLARSLAIDLCESAKANAKQRASSVLNIQSVVDLMALGGVDVPARNLLSERATVYRVAVEEQGSVFPFPLTGAGKMLDAFAALKGVSGDRETGVPRGKLAAILDSALLSGVVGRGGAASDEQVKALYSLLGNPRYRHGLDRQTFGEDFIEKLIDEADGTIPGETRRSPLAPLLLLMELWNYIGFGARAAELDALRAEGRAA